MISPNARILLTFALMALVAAPLRADQVVVAGRSYLGAKVVSYEGGRLSFRTADGRTETCFVDQIELLIVDRSGLLEDFNQAERFLAEGDDEKAGICYDRVARLATDFWADIAALRAVQAHDRSQQIDKAALAFIRTVRGKFSGPSAAARVLPTGVAGKRDSKITRAIEQLDLALLQDPGDAIRVLMELLRYDVLRRADDTRAARFAIATAGLVVPEELLTERTCAVLRWALTEALRSDATVERLAALDRTIAGCPDSSVGGLLVLKGDTLVRSASTREDFIRASWPYLRVAAHRSDEPEAADALIGAAKALERAGRVDYALKLLEQAIAHPRASDAPRRIANESLERLRKTNPTTEKP